MDKTSFGQRVTDGFGRALLLGASGSVLALALGATSAFASGADGADTASSTGTSDIVVTAQRKEEKLSKVPVSVVAFGAETLKDRNITSEQDMESLVPGLQVKNGQNTNMLSFAMRGQTLDPFSGTSPAVLTYINEAPYTPGNTSTEFFDLGSIQVVKGPQGTLFGRNATGGAVLYSTVMPGDQFDGYVTYRGAQRDYNQVSAAVDIPIAPGLFVMRLAVNATKGDGYIKDVNPVNNGETLGAKDSRSFRGTFVFTPTDTIKNTTIIQYDDVKGTEGEGSLWNYYTAGTGTPGSQQVVTGYGAYTNPNSFPLSHTLYSLYASPAQNSLSNPMAPGSWPGGPAGYLQWARAHPYDTWNSQGMPHLGHNTFLSNTTEIKLGDDLKLKNIASFMQGYAAITGNLASGPFAGLWLYNLPNNTEGLSNIQGEQFYSTAFSEEMQVQGKAMDSRLAYTAGLFYSSQIRNEIIPITIGDDVIPGGAADIDYAYHNQEYSKAVYAQASYNVTDKLTATLGGRYTWEIVGENQNVGSIFGTGSPPQHKTLSAPAWTFSLNYQLDGHNMVYFDQRGSFRSGNFNGTVYNGPKSITDPTPQNFFGNEYVHDFEVGYKFNGHLGDAPVQFNIALYDEAVKHAQHALYAIVGGNPAGFTVNVPEAITKGVEVDGFAGVASWLDLSFNLAYTDAKYTQGTVPIPGADNLTVDSYPDTPLWSGSAAVDLKFPVPENYGKVDLRTEFYAQSHTYFSSTNGSATPDTALSGYSTIGMHLNWKEIMKSNVSASVYVRNIGDKLYYIAGYALGASSGMNTTIPGEPRTIGAELNVKF